MVKPAHLIRFRIDFADNSNVGPGKIALLEGIARSGSLAAAARGMGMSYRRAWLLLESLNRSFDEPATVTSAGGREGGGSQVTPFGVLLTTRYRELEKKLNDLAGECLREVADHAKRAAGTATRKGPVSRRRVSPRRAASKPARRSDPNL